MKAKDVIGLVLVTTLSLISSVSFADDLKREQDLSKKEGQEAPTLSVAGWINTEDGKPLDLAALRGKVVVIDFWGIW